MSVDGYELADRLTRDGVTATFTTLRFVRFQSDDVQKLETLADEVPEPWEYEYFRSEDGTPTLGIHVDALEEDAP